MPKTAAATGIEQQCSLHIFMQPLGHQQPQPPSRQTDPDPKPHRRPDKTPKPPESLSSVAHSNVNNSGGIILQCVWLGKSNGSSLAATGLPGRPGSRVRVKQGGHRPRDVRTIFLQPHQQQQQQQQQHQTQHHQPQTQTQPQPQEDPRVPEEKGEGHSFSPCAVYNWCDVCGQRINMCREAVRCQNCNCTTHQDCRNFIKLDCQQWGKLSEETVSTGTTTEQTADQNVEKEEEKKQTVLTKEEVKQKVEQYNGQVKNCFGMRLSADGSYTGFVKVHLRLRRPVTVPAGIRPQSIYDVLKEVNPAEITDKRTSFYLPLDADKQLHISSRTTVSEVIVGLLKKFMVIDNPQKFVLFYQTKEDEKVNLQRLRENEHPLLIRLLAGPDTDASSFVLKEHETGEVEWDAFSVPELQNFLLILEKEEKERVQQLQERYVKFRQKLEEALKVSGKPA